MHDYCVQQVTIQPDFVPDVRRLRYDIAVIRLADYVRFDGTITLSYPVCNNLITY